MYNITYFGEHPSPAGEHLANIIGRQNLRYIAQKYVRLSPGQYARAFLVDITKKKTT
jgi:hypothetical protein